MLDHVVVGQPHTQAHNDERDVLNRLSVRADLSYPREVNHAFNDGIDVGVNLNGKFLNTGQTIIGTGAGAPIYNYFNGSTFPADAPFSLVSLGAAPTAYYLLCKTQQPVLCGGGTFRFYPGTDDTGGGALGAFVDPNNLIGGGASMHLGFDAHTVTIGVVTGGALKYLKPNGRPQTGGNQLTKKLSIDGTQYSIAWAIDRDNNRAVIRAPDGQILHVFDPAIGALGAMYPFWEGVLSTANSNKVEWLSLWADSYRAQL